jgi:rare lipoprotein A
MAFTLGVSFDKEKGVKTSTASYYHDKFNGRKTASGEIFDNKKMTAANANKTLPFGTKVKITNLKNEKSVIVRVNDRGPFSKKRAFDLSKAAFSKIADLRSGVVSISYEVVE